MDKKISDNITKLNASKASKKGNHHINPEMMFLIRQQAKTVCVINSISKRLEQLEVKVNEMQQKATKQSSNVMTTSTASGLSVKDGAAAGLSDDSGGEYSRVTTEANTDDDELLSLLDQISKHSHRLQKTPQKQTTHLVEAPVGSSSYRYSQTPFNGPSQPSSANLSQYSMISNPLQSQKQSLSAFLFDPNVDRFLSNLDKLITDRSPMVPNSTCLTQLSYGSASSPSIRYAGDVQSSGLLSSSSSNNKEWHQIEAFRKYVRLKEQEDVESQTNLADEFLVNHIKERQLIQQQQNCVNRQQQQQQSINPRRYV